MKSQILKILFLLSIVMLSSCEEDDKRLTFIGDSIVARWDLEVSFPSYVVENKGVSGSGIASFENYAHKFSGEDIVVIIGTNDLGRIADETMASYAQEYVQQIIATDAHMIYLYSILPRNFESDVNDINEKIQALNALIKKEAEGYANIVYIDAFSRFINDDKIEKQYSYDGLHLSPYGYEILSELLISNLK